MSKVEPESFIQILRAVIDGQKQTGDTLRALGRRHDEIVAAIDRLSRHQSRIEEKVDNSRREQGATMVRLDAHLRRFDDIEAQIDRNFHRLLEAQGELHTLQNQTLEAINSSLDRQIESSSLSERVEILEMKFGSG